MTFVRRNIEKMKGYTYGEQPSDPSLIKLNTNENPYPPSPNISAHFRAFDFSRLRFYPNATASSLRKAIAKHLELEPKQILITNGADEGIRLVFSTFVDPGDAIATTEPGYTLYDVMADIHQVSVFATSMTKDWLLPDNVVDIWNKHKIKLAVLVNPHAPTGSFFPAAYIRHLLTDSHRLLLLDEAYVDFVTPCRAFR